MSRRDKGDKHDKHDKIDSNASGCRALASTRRTAGSPEALIESRYLVFAGVTSLLVLPLGVAMAVVTRNAIAGGRFGAILTVLGINCGNSVYALSSALGLSVIFTQTSAAVDTVKVVGALYLGGLGVQSVWRTASGESLGDPPARRTSRTSLPGAMVSRVWSRLGGAASQRDC